MWQWSARVGPSLVDALQDGRTSVKPAVLELDLGGFLIRDLQWMLLAAWVDRLTYVWNSLPFFWALQQFLPACRSLVLVLCCAGRTKVQSCTTICRGIGPPNLGFRSTHCNSSESWWDWVGGDSVEFPSFFVGGCRSVVLFCCAGGRKVQSCTTARSGIGAPVLGFLRSLWVPGFGFWVCTLLNP